MKISLNSYLYLNLLNIQTLEEVFIKYGELEAGCFSVFTKTCSDGSSGTYFDAPTDMTPNKAHKLVEKIAIKIMKIKLCDLVDRT